MAQRQLIKPKLESTRKLLGQYGRGIIFSSLKSEKIKRKIDPTRADEKSEIFEYNEIFYNHTKCHKHLNQLSPMEFERRQYVL